ncbi:MAG: hypothetical protein C0501_22580, partial [Isosphaera sp.]|nr:hypothetical protein [Isosphaera sp.]
RGGSDAESFTVTVATAAPQAPAGYAAPDGGGKPSSGRFPDDPSGAGNRPSVGAATEEIGGEDVTLVLDGTDGGDSAVADDGAADEVLWGGPGLDLYPGCMCSVCCRQ